MNNETIKIHGALFKAEPVVVKSLGVETGTIHEVAEQPRRQNEYWSLITGLSPDTRYSVEVSSTCTDKSSRLYGKRLGSVQWFETTIEAAKKALDERLGVAS